MDAYRQRTDLRVQEDPHAAVGGLWEELGKLQFEFLVRQGLQRAHVMLDIGCGTLRGGRHFIRFLKPRRYFGIDVSEKAIEHAKRLVDDEGLRDRLPTLIANVAGDLRFADLDGTTFDFILAQSVFTHLGPELIRECFEHVGAVMLAAAQNYTEVAGENVTLGGPVVRAARRRV